MPKAEGPEPEGTVMGWCPNCRAEGKKGNAGPRARRGTRTTSQQGEPQRYCGLYSLSFAKAKERFRWAD